MGLKMKRRAKGAGGGAPLRDSDFPTKAAALGARKHGTKKGRK